MVAPPSSLPSKRKILAYVAGAFIARLLWKLGKFIHHILTSVDQSKILRYNCLPPKDYRHQDVVQQSSRELVKAKYPQLLSLVDSGALIAVQPANMLKQRLEKLQEEQGGNIHAPGLTQEDLEELMASSHLQACMSAPVPELMFFLGTVHVSKQSAEDVRNVLRALQPSVVLLELCHQRLHALLIDPYDNPLTDLEPSKDKMAQHAALKHKTLPEILKAALASRDHNVLTTIMTGMYSRFEDKLEVRAGVEFIAARQVLIEMLQDKQSQHQLQQQQDQPMTSSGDPVQQQQQQQEELSADDAITESAAASLQQQDQHQGEEAGDSDHHHQQQVEPSWLQYVVPGDRPVMDTLLGLWGSLRPWRRLHFIWDLLNGLMEEIDEETIKSLANEDMVELLIKEFSDTYPEVMKPLLHDRNWVLAANSWHVAQQAAGQDGPVVAIVGKGHLGGMVYVCEKLVGMFARSGGMPVRLVRQQQGV